MILMRGVDPVKAGVIDVGGGDIGFSDISVTF